MTDDHFPPEERIRQASRGEISAAAELDSAGFLIKPGERSSEYADRISAMRARARSLLQTIEKRGSCEIYPGIHVSPGRRMPDEIIEEAARITEPRYGYAIRWAPGYFPDRELGMLWGGCAVCEDAPDAVPVFIIRRNFEHSERWFVYTRSELLSHELCHAARMPLHDRPLEEHFAYALSRSVFRRSVGNCFQTERDAIFLLLPIFLLLGVQIAINLFGAPLSAWPFWILAFLWPAYLLIRNARQRESYFRAERVVSAAGFTNAPAVLYRCTSPEIASFAAMSPEKFRAMAEQSQEFRWKVIRFRFGPG